jgi:exosortase A-associated hydrolase 1
VERNVRTIVNFPCGTDSLSGAFDAADGTTGLLILSGGNEIRSGAYAGQAAIAQYFQALGYPVFRFDRCGIGDSEGHNRGFEHSADDIAAALEAFRALAPQLRNVVGFGNCDAATALTLFPDRDAFSALILTNPWTIDAVPGTAQAAAPNTAAIRARYWARLKSPRSIIDLLTGKIDIKKLASGLAKAKAREPASDLATRIAAGFVDRDEPVALLLAERDTTALAFRAAWRSQTFQAVRAKDNISLSTYDTASHSFADPAARTWLYGQVEKSLRRQSGL